MIAEEWPDLQTAKPTSIYTPDTVKKRLTKHQKTGMEAYGLKTRRKWLQPSLLLFSHIDFWLEGTSSALCLWKRSLLQLCLYR